MIEKTQPETWRFWIEVAEIPNVGKRPSAFMSAPGEPDKPRGLCWCDDDVQAKEIGLKLARTHIAWIHHRRDEKYVDVVWKSHLAAELTFKP